MILKNSILAALVIIVLSGMAFAQSKDINNPTPVSSNTFQGKTGPEGGVFYYSQTVPKGALAITLSGQTDYYSVLISVDIQSKSGEKIGNVTVNVDETEKSKSESINIDSQQTVIFAVTLQNDSVIKSQRFKVTLGAGKVTTPVEEKKDGAADLSVKQFSFDVRNNKNLKVEIINNGSAASSGCKLELTIRKINGSAVGRTTTVDIPAINAGETLKITVDASKILPKSVNLKDTTFKIIVDSANALSESNETNNEVWHNLN